MKKRLVMIVAAVFTAMICAAECAAPAACPYSTDQQQGNLSDYPHSQCGVLINLQEPCVVDILNAYFRDRGHALGFPEQLTVRPHENGRSLTYEWIDSCGVRQEMHQTARPSLLFTVISFNGKFINAQERRWGFVTTYRRFGRKPAHEKADTILHEFVHQFAHIRSLGAPCYWTSYSAQFVTKGYSRVSFEKEAEKVSLDFRDYLANHYCGNGATP